jgi:hypothetical protein
MITRAVLCPATPLLARPLSGREPVLPDLRAACADAVKWLLTPRPPAVVIVAPGAKTASHDPARLDLSRFAPGMPPGSGTPTGIGLGAMLLDEAGWDGPRTAWTVAGTDGAVLGQRLNDAVLLALGDGSAARLLAQRGAALADEFDATVEEALRSGDLGSVDIGLAESLTATGWPVWQVLAAALGTPSSGEVLYSAAPLSVRYYIAELTREGAPDGRKP